MTPQTTPPAPVERGRRDVAHVGTRRNSARLPIGYIDCGDGRIAFVDDVTRRLIFVETKGR